MPPKLSLTNEDPALDQEPEGSTTADLPAEEDNAEHETDLDAGDGEGEGTDTATGEEDKSKGDEYVIALEGDKPKPKQEPAPRWLKNLRESERKKSQRIEELERELAQTRGPAANDPGPKPTPESCAYDWDEYEKKLEGWQKAQAAKAEADKQAAQQAEASRRAWQAVQDGYNAQTAELSKRIPGFVEAEKTAKEALNPYQYGIILKGTKFKPALVMAYLGQHPEALQDLASTQDLTDFTYKVADIGAKIKMEKRSAAPPPERPSPRGGSGGVSGGGDKHLEHLRKEAERTGNITPVTDYLRELKRKQSQKK